MFGDNKEELSILIYISTAKISVAFTQFLEDKIPNVIYSTSLAFPSSLKLDDFSSPETITTLLDKSLTNLINNGITAPVLKMKQIHIKSVLVTFSTPWFTVKVKDLHLEQKVPFVVSESFIENILQVEEKKFESEITESIASNDQNVVPELSIIENTFTHSKVNGYSIPNSIGKKVNNFDISLYASFLPKELVKDTLSVIHKHTHLNVDKIFINTFPLIFFHAIKNMFSSSNSFLFMNVEGEMTNLTLVHDSGIIRNLSFPSAKNFITRKIAKSFDVSIEIADSMLHMFNLEKLDNEFSQKMKDTLDDVEKEWSIYFEDALTELSKSVSLPAVIYMVADSDIAILYSNFLKIAKMQSDITLRKNLNIVHIDPNSFSNFCNFSLGVKKDEHIAALSVFHNTSRLGNF